MKRIALDRVAQYRFIQEPQVERGIVPDQDRTGASLFPYGAPDLAKNSLQCVAFIDCRSKGVEGVNPVHGQGGWLQVGAFEGLYVITNRFSTQECAVFLRVDQDCSDLQQCVSLAVESAGLDVDDNGKKSAESVCN